MLIRKKLTLTSKKSSDKEVEFTDSRKWLKTYQEKRNWSK